MDKQDIEFLKEVLDDLEWARSMLNIGDYPCGDILDKNIAKLNKRIEELDV